jgi:hypothetical protein
MSEKAQHKEWMALKEAIMGKYAKKMDVILDTLQDEEFSVQYFKVLEYVIPKLQRQEVELETAEDLTIKVEIIKSKANEISEKN